MIPRSLLSRIGLTLHSYRGSGQRTPSISGWTTHGWMAYGLMIPHVVYHTWTSHFVLLAQCRVGQFLAQVPFWRVRMLIWWKFLFPPQKAAMYPSRNNFRLDWGMVDLVLMNRLFTGRPALSITSKIFACIVLHKQHKDSVCHHVSSHPFPTVKDCCLWRSLLSLQFSGVVQQISERIVHFC